MHELKSCKLKFSNLTLEICIKIFGHFWMKAVLSYRSLGNWVVVICSLVSWNSWEEVSQDPSCSIWVCSIVSSQRCLLTVVLCLIMWSVHQYSRHSPFYQDIRIKYMSCPAARKSTGLFLSVGKVMRLSINNSEWIHIELWIGWWAGLSEANTRYFQVCIFTICFNIYFFFFKLEHIFLQKRKRRKVTGSFSHLYVCLLWKK